MSKLNKDDILKLCKTIFPDIDIQDKVDFLFELKKVEMSERYNEIIEILSNKPYGKSLIINKDDALLYFKYLFLQEVLCTLRIERYKTKNNNLTTKQIVLKILSLDFLQKAIHGAPMIKAIREAISNTNHDSRLDLFIMGMLLGKI